MQDLTDVYVRELCYWIDRARTVLLWEWPIRDSEHKARVTADLACWCIEAVQADGSPMPYGIGSSILCLFDQDVFSYFFGINCPNLSPSVYEGWLLSALDAIAVDDV